MDLISAYIVHQADDALILGHRNSEWTGHGPILEQDIALSNIALDQIGQARNFYQLAATRITELSGDPVTEDDLAYLRDVPDFRNCILVELPKGDWGQTILRQFYFSIYQYLLYLELQQSQLPEIAAIAEKSIKETRYHVKWSSEWVIRLGDGTEESHSRLIDAMYILNPCIAELFIPSDYEYEAAGSGVGILPEAIEMAWFEQVNKVLMSATLPVLKAGKKTIPILSGKNGVHSEHLGHLLAEMQFLQRTYPGNSW
jgi:ring-1,2-phenylacetyl-CoA epoxidase subunit PaaC